MLYIGHDLARIWVVDWLIYCSEKHASSVLILVQNILIYIWDHHRLKLYLFLIINNLVIIMIFTKLVDRGLVLASIVDRIFKLALMRLHEMHWLKTGILSSAYRRESCWIRLCFLEHWLSLDLGFIIICRIHSTQACLLVLYRPWLILISNIYPYLILRVHYYRLIVFIDFYKHFAKFKIN